MPQNPFMYDPSQALDPNQAILSLFDPQMQDASYQQPQQSQDLSALSAKIQEALGAKQPDQGGMAKDILSARFNTEPSYGDYASGIVQSALGKPALGPDVAESRVSNQLKQISMMNKMGEQPSAVQEYEYYSKLPPDAQARYLNVKRASQIMNLGGQMSVYEPRTGGVSSTFEKTLPPQDTPAVKGAQTAAQEAAKQGVDNQQAAKTNQDIVGMYNKLLEDATSAPSGVLESGWARAMNAANMPTKGSIAQGTFDADLNNLYLATIRSLKGTGRVMEQELVKIAEAAPKSTDSMEVKIAKAKAHMAYYTQRMQGLLSPALPMGDGAPSPVTNTTNENDPLGIR